MGLGYNVLGFFSTRTTLGSEKNKGGRKEGGGEEEGKEKGDSEEREREREIRGFLPPLQQKPLPPLEVSWLVRIHSYSRKSIPQRPGAVLSAKWVYLLLSSTICSHKPSHLYSCDKNHRKK